MRAVEKKPISNSTQKNENKKKTKLSSQSSVTNVKKNGDRSVWDDIDDILEDEPELVNALPKYPKPSLSPSPSPSPSSPSLNIIKKSTSSNSSPSIPSTSSPLVRSALTKSPPPPLSSSPSLPNSPSLTVSPSLSLSPTLSHARSFNNKKPLQREVARLSMPFDKDFDYDENEEELRKQMEIQEEQYLLQQQQQQLDQQMTPPSVTSLPVYPSLTSPKSTNQSPTNLRRTQSKIPDKNSGRQSELSDTYTQLLQLQVMQASHQKKIDQLHALHAHSQMQFITLLSNSSYADIQSYAPSSETPELPRINSKTTGPTKMASSKSLKSSVLSPTSTPVAPSVPAFPSIASSSLSIDSTSRSTSNPHLSINSPPSRNNYPIDTSPPSPSHSATPPRSLSTYPFSLSSNSSFSSAYSQPSLSLSANSITAEYDEDEEEEEDEEEFFRQLKDSAREMKQGEERKAMKIKKAQEINDMEHKQHVDEKVTRQTSDTTLDAILAEINSSFNI